MNLTIATTPSIGGIAFPPANDNIKRVGLIEVLKMSMKGSGMVSTVFHALNGSATLLPDVARTYKDITFVLFAFNVYPDTVKEYANTFKTPNNFIIYGVHHPGKGASKDYGKLIIAGKNKKNIVLRCRSSPDRALGVRMRNDVLYQFALERHAGETNIRFDYALDNELFRSAMVNWFMEQFANVDFAELGIKYIATVAGSGLISYLLAKALSLLGVTGISFILVSVGANPTVNEHDTMYPTQVVKSPIRYLESFDFANLPSDIRCQLADVGVTGAGYDGKVFYPFINAEYSWKDTMFLIVRNGY